MSQYVAKPYGDSSRNLGVELELKGATGVDKSNLLANSDVASLKVYIGKLILI